jgi:hypothetical protein
VGQSLESNPEKGVKTVRALVGLAENGLWDEEMESKDQLMSRLEERLGTLEAKAEQANNFGLIPGMGIAIGSLGFLWMDRKRRRKDLAG